MKVLIIEDEKALSDSIFTYLNSEQYVCEIAADYHSAMSKISQYDYACIILDINLPGGSGLDILKELKAGQKGGRCADHFSQEFAGRQAERT